MLSILRSISKFWELTTTVSFSKILSNFRSESVVWWGYSSHATRPLKTRLLQVFPPELNDSVWGWQSVSGVRLLKRSLVTAVVLMLTVFRVQRVVSTMQMGGGCVTVRWEELKHNRHKFLIKTVCIFVKITLYCLCTVIPTTNTKLETVTAHSNLINKKNERIFFNRSFVYFVRKMNILGHFDLSVTESGDVNENSRNLIT